MLLIKSTQNSKLDKNNLWIMRTIKKPGITLPNLFYGDQLR